MAPRVYRSEQSLGLLLVVALALFTAAECRDYFSNPSGELRGKFPPKVVQEATAGVQRPVKQNGERSREQQPVEMHDMLNGEIREKEGGKSGGVGRSTSGDRDVYSDPNGPLKGKFSAKIVEEAAQGKKRHFGKGLEAEVNHQPLEIIDLLESRGAEVQPSPETAKANPKAFERANIGPALQSADWEETAEGEAVPVLGTRDRSRLAAHGRSRNETRTRAQSLKWGRKGRPLLEGSLRKNLTSLDKAAAKLILGSRNKPHRHPVGAQTASRAWPELAMRSERSMVERRALSEADNQKLNLIGVVTQTAAVRAVANASEGIPVFLPAGVDGVSLVAVKLRTALLETAGFSLLNVVIPRGVQVPGNASVVILVFSQFGQNPYGFTNQTVVGPVVGITAYDAADPNAGAANSSLPLTASRDAPFEVAFNTTSPGSDLSCSSYNRDVGQLVNTSLTTDVAEGGSRVTCATTTLGTFTVISTGALAPLPAPAPAPGPAPAPAVVAAPPANLTGPPVASNITNNGSGTNGTLAAPRDRGGSTISGGAIAGIVIGSVAGLAILALLALLLARRSEQSKIARMTQRSRDLEPLTTALIGGQQGFRAPVASHLRTRPGLEGEMYL